MTVAEAERITAEAQALATSGDLAAARAILAEALGQCPPSAARARLLYADGRFAFRQGRQDESRLANEEALDLARTVKDATGEALALVGLSRVAFRDGEYARVIELAQSARAIDDRTPAPLHLEAAGNRLAGNLVAARALYEESLRRNRGTAMASVELHNLLHVELHLGEIESARERFAELERQREAGNAYNKAMRSLNLAALAHVDGDDHAARAHLEACVSTLSNDGVALDPDDQYEVDRLRDEL